MQKIALITLLLAASFTLHAETLVREGGVELTRKDVIWAIQEHVPSAHRQELLTNETRMRDFIAQLFATRRLAKDALAVDLSEHEQWRISNAAERLRVQIYLDALVSNISDTTLENAALESYIAHPDRLKTPERIRVRHILLSTEERPEDAARQLAEELLERLEKGESFEEMALQYSDDESVSDNKGDLGFFERGRMVGSFEEAAFGLNQASELVGPVKTEFGFHIIQLIERKPAVLPPFEEVREQLMNAERGRLRRTLTAREYERVGALPGIEADQAKIQKLISDLSGGVLPEVNDSDK